MSVFVFQSFRGARETREPGIPKFSSRDSGSGPSVHPGMTLYSRMTLSGAALRRKKASSFDHDDAARSRPALLLEWYDRHRRKLPWRPLPGELADPYSVWLSGILLQQTGVKTVMPYFEKFLVRWPDVDALGRASLDDVLRMWAGLGYYSRARNLHACAVAVLRNHGGVFPDTEEGLRLLPGIGPYTAAAIAALPFLRRTVPAHANIHR